MNICMLTSEYLPSMGGVQNDIHNIVNELKRKGYNTIIINPILSKPKTKKRISIEYIDDTKVYRIYLGDGWIKKRNERNVDKFTKLDYLFKWQYNLYTRKMYKLISSILSDEDIDIIHQHSLIEFTKISKMLSANYPIILTNHEEMYHDMVNNIKRHKYIINNMNHFKYIIGPSRELMYSPINSMINKAIYIPSGVNTHELIEMPNNSKIKQKITLGLDDDDFVILCPKRCEYHKGINVLAEAIQYINTDKKVKYIFTYNNDVDSDGYKNMVNEMFKRYDQDKLKFIGHVDYEDIVKFYQVANIVVIPSLIETTSLSCMEAMACGALVVCSDAGNLKEIVQDGYTGLVFEKKDCKALARQIEFAINNEVVSGKIISNAKKNIIDNYSCTHTIDKIIELYKSIV